MQDPLLIYGATGFTGRLMVREAIARGLRPMLAGRSPERLTALAQPLGLECRAAELCDGPAVAAMLADVQVVLNAAGPFRLTAPTLAEACIARGIHYLDITGEISSIEELARLDASARERGSMLLPGAGFDVVPSDCMAAWVARLLPGADCLSIALSGLNSISRGSAATALDQYNQLVTVRRQGRLVRVSPGELTAEFDFGAGLRRTSAISWGDVASAYYSTRIPDITVYFEETPVLAFGLGVGRHARWLLETPLSAPWRDAALALLPEGPTAQQQAKGRAVVIARATKQGRYVEVRLETPEVYSFTAVTSVAIADRVLAGDVRPGFQTPSRAYGPEYVLSFPGVTFSPPS